MSLLSGAYFDVYLFGNGISLGGNFLSVSGLDMEFDYEVYCEGGSSYPRYFFKNAKPQTLVLEQGTVTSVDSVAILINMVNLGISVPLAGTIMLRDSFGNVKRVWTVAGAHMVKYVGPSLNSNQPNLAVSRIELMHNGCS
ncbi:MAG: phage tail protein [Oscillospiraceae bacterium]|nr:phage tail protein [Oscillospiraceae bacterium]MCD8390043.1 phage tail protein [Oscillospiraceae bacterium]